MGQGCPSDKPCIRCGLVKSLGEYYRHPQMADGHLNKCKECCKEQASTRHYDSASRGRIREYERRRSLKPHRKKLRAKWGAENPARERALKAKWREKNREKRKAHFILGNAVRAGKVKRQPCEQCGAKKAHGHHHDYSNPLDVTWLCPACHGMEHRKINIETGRDRRSVEP